MYRREKSRLSVSERHPVITNLKIKRKGKSQMSWATARKREAVRRTYFPLVKAKAVLRPFECLSRMRIEHAANLEKGKKKKKIYMSRGSVEKEDRQATCRTYLDGWNSNPWTCEKRMRSNFLCLSPDLKVETTLEMRGMGM
jgi:hypothetical protein